MRIIITKKVAQAALPVNPIMENESCAPLSGQQKRHGATVSVPQTEDKLYFFIEVPQGNDLSIVVRPKGLHIHQPKMERKYIAWSDGPSELL
ncbi:MAG: hypothetical protein DF221_03055 [Brevibacillus sp.]|jgi:hypothetical protein|nr:MAG: hypothetical protein DF221_03055 [Brevibacillus sp.]